MIAVDFLEKINTCSCGYILQKADKFCQNCGKKRFSLAHLDSSHGKASTSKKASKFSMNDLCNDIIDDFF